MKLKGVLAPYFAVAIRFIFLLVIYALLRLGFYGINASLFPHIDAGKLLVMFAGVCVSTS
ncbi:hypothetical protein [Sphingobacterium zeae]|uniref:hypothetical protein n=1 Tax=Sphingobacterium zeae TaxID=1776859 RepID=UPI00361BAE95